MKRSDSELKERRHRRRWWKWLLGVLGGLLMLIIGLVLAIVWIPAASQWVIREALIRWDATNPAQLRWRSIEGSIGAGLRVVDLELHDGDARPLLTVERLELELALRALLGGVAKVERLELTGVEVWAAHRWADLADPDAPERPPKPGYGPDLPIEIVATIIVGDARVWLDEREHIEARRLQVHGWGLGREAEAELVAEGLALPGQDLLVDSLELAARWDSPIVRLDRLTLTSPLLELEQAQGVFDVALEAGELALEADARLEALADRFELDLTGLGERARIRLDARGGPRALDLRLALDLGERGELHVDAAGVPTGPTARRWADARVRGRVEPGVLLDDARLGPLRFDLRAAIRGRERMPGLVASLIGEIEEARSGERLEIQAEARASSIDPLHGRATLELRGAGLDLDAQVERDPVGLRGRWSLHIPALERPLGLAAGLLGQPALAEIRGRLAASGRCEAIPADRLDSLICRSELRLRRARGFGSEIDELHVQAQVAPLAAPPALEASLIAAGVRPPGEAPTFEHLRIEARGTLERLRVRIDGHGDHERLQIAGMLALGERIDVALDQLALHSDRGGVITDVVLRHPTRVSVGAGTLEIDALSLAVAGGRIDVDGRLGFAARTTSDLRLSIAELELARLDPLVPGPSFAGRLSLESTLIGTLAEPSVSVWLRGHGLRVAGLRPGDVELLAALGRPAPGELTGLLVAELGELAQDYVGLRVWARARGPMAARLVLAAALPLALPLDEGVRLIPGRELAARVIAKRFDLIELGPLMPITPSWWQQPATGSLREPRLIPEGVVDLDLSLAGSPERPRASATVLLRRLVVDQTRLGSLLARASLDAAGLGLELAAKPGFAQLELRARVPARLDLARARLDWDEHDQHLVSLDVRGLDLGLLHATLGPKIPALEQALSQAQIDGRLALGLQAAGTLDQPRLTAAVRVLNLRHREQALGQLGLFGAYAPGQAELELKLDGPLARRLDARIYAPLWLGLDGELPRIEPTHSVLARVQLDQLSLGLLAHHLDGLPVAGLLSGAVELTGSLADPRVELRARLDELATASRSVPGELMVAAGYQAGRVRIDADMLRAGALTMAAVVELPLIAKLSEDLRGSTFRWDSSGRHRIFATGRGIDEELLAALLGRSIAATLDGRSRATELAFDISGGGTLDAFRIDGGLTGRVVVDDELALALDVGLALNETGQWLELSLEPSQGPGLDGRIELDAVVPALVGGEQTWAEIPVRAALRAPGFDLRSVAPLLPASLVDPHGMVHIDVDGRGTLGAPRLRGAVELDEAAVTVVPMRQRLSAIEIDMALDERSIEVRRASLRAGRGGIEARGRADFGEGGTLDADATLELDAFPLIRPGLPAMTIDTRTSVELRRRADATRMTVALRDSRVVVAGASEAPPDPIPSSPDVVFVRRLAPEVPAEPEAEPVDRGRFELRVDLRDPLSIAGASIDMAWAGEVELVIDGGEVEVGGEVVARRGRLRLLGNAFDLRRGIVTLPADGTVDPYLDLEAVAELPEAEVTVTVRGRVSRPSLEFSSNPALGEYQILTLLVTGSTEIGEADGDVAARAASLLAAVSNPQLQNQLNQRLGLDRIALGFGETIDQPILTIGKRFGRDVYVETQYHHNAPEDQNTTQIAIDYSIRRRWSLEGFFGDAAVGAVGLYWTRSFPPARWTSDLELPSYLVVTP